MKKYIFSIIFFIGQLVSFSQVLPEFGIAINKYNSIGEKTGFWSKIFVWNLINNYYKKGKENGICVVYGRLRGIEEINFYHNDIPIGTCYSFDHHNRLLSIRKYVGYIYIKGKRQLKSYLKIYNNDGKIDGEGYITAKIGEEWETKDYGKWKRYDTAFIWRQRFTEFKDYNLFDSNHQKTGFWVEKEGAFNSDAYYKNGQKNGMHKVFYNNKFIKEVSFFSNGLPTGTAYHFHQRGFLVYTNRFISFNKIGKKFLEKHYYEYYDANGEVVNKGYGYQYNAGSLLYKIGKW